MARSATDSIGVHLLKELHRRGLHHIFGIPGDYVLGFYDMIEASEVTLVTTCTEAAAGFAADAYARINGIGATCVTYCVGGLNLCNSVAGAYAEKSPVVVISGAPGMLERTDNPLLHHKVRDFNTQKEIFEKITVAHAVLQDGDTAAAEIRRVLDACETHKRPVYLELPRDRVHLPVPRDRRRRPTGRESNPLALEEALAEATARLKKAKRPVILAGVEVHRFGLQDELVELIEHTKIPVAATLLGKSVIRENHPQYLGIYEGTMGWPQVQKRVEAADCVLLLGAFMTDINLGIFTADLDPAKCIDATSERIRIGYHTFGDVRLEDFMVGLADVKLPAYKPRPIKRPIAKKFKVRKNAAMTITRCFQQIDVMLTDDMVVVADIGDSLFGASDLNIHARTEFVSPAYYTSMGFAVPAALGVQCADPDLRPLVIVGDGAFQMTGHEMSTLLRLEHNAIIIVLNNHGYATERQIQDGRYNDIADWQYHRIVDLFGQGRGFNVQTEGEFEAALTEAVRDERQCSILNVHFAKDDRSPAMGRLAERLSKRLR